MTAKKTMTPAMARSRLGKAMVQHLVADFEANGADVIARIRTSKPVDYVKLVTGILDEEAVTDATFAPLYNVVERQIVRPENPDG
jgi:hypothetical protein